MELGRKAKAKTRKPFGFVRKIRRCFSNGAFFKAAISLLQAGRTHCLVPVLCCERIILLIFFRDESSPGEGTSPVARAVV